MEQIARAKLGHVPRVVSWRPKQIPRRPPAGPPAAKALARPLRAHPQAAPRPHAPPRPHAAPRPHAPPRPQAAPPSQQVPAAKPSQQVPAPRPSQAPAGSSTGPKAPLRSPKLGPRPKPGPRQPTAAPPAHLLADQGQEPEGPAALPPPPAQAVQGSSAHLEADSGSAMRQQPPTDPPPGPQPPTDPPPAHLLDQGQEPEGPAVLPPWKDKQSAGEREVHEGPEKELPIEINGIPVKGSVAVQIKRLREMSPLSRRQAKAKRGVPGSSSSNP